MAETTKAQPEKIERGIVLRSWLGMLLPTVAWITQLEVLWFTSEYGCKHANFTWNHVTSVAALLLALLGFWLSFHELRSAGDGTDDDDATRVARRRFMGLIGVLTGALFATVIVAQWLPTLTGVPCDK